MFSSCAKTLYEQKEFHVNQSEDSTFGQVYLIRPNYLGFLIRYQVFSNHEPIGKLGPSSYLNWKATPGAVEVLTLIGHLKGTINLDVRPGHKYYLKQQIIGNAIICKPEIILLDSVKGQDCITRLNMKMQ